MRFAALFLVFVPMMGVAFEPLNTDDAGTVSKGSNQIEQYFYKISTHGGGSPAPIETSSPGEEYFGNGNANALPFTYTRGISENIEASIGATYFINPRGSYSPISNKVVAMKWRFAEDGDGKWALAIKPAIGLPGSPQQQVHGLSLALPSYGLNLIGSRYWDLVELHLNASYTKTAYNTNYQIAMSAPNNRTNILFLSAAPVWTLTPGLRLALDVGVVTNSSNTDQQFTNYGLLAAIFSPADNLDIGLSYLRSAANIGCVLANTGANSSRSEIGFTWRF